jgi:hypothetical protein
MTRIVVIGGGIAGVEAALTLSRTLSRAQVTLVSQWPSLRLLPQLVYVPFGGAEHGIDVRLDRALAPEGIDLVVATCNHVDLHAQRVELSDGALDYDILVIATGTVPEPTTHHRLRSLTDAIRLRTALDQLAESHERDSSVALRVPASCTWPPPAFEVALLLARWRDDRAAGDIRITVEVEESDPLEIFNLDAAMLIRDRMERAGIELLTHIPSHRLDQLSSSVAIDFGGLTAHRLFGLPSVSPDGFYRVDHAGCLVRNVYVVGDAAASSYKAGFAVGWHARRVAAALGADLSLLGPFVDGIPIDRCEFQMDMGDELLRVRFSAPYTGPLAHDLHVTDASCSAGHPDKLVGTLTHELVARAKRVRAAQSTELVHLRNGAANVTVPTRTSRDA